MNSSSEVHSTFQFGGNALAAMHVKAPVQKGGRNAAFSRSEVDG
jgi:hypothetical protein